MYYFIGSVTVPCQGLHHSFVGLDSIDLQLNPRLQLQLFSLRSNFRQAEDAKFKDRPDVGLSQLDSVFADVVLGKRNPDYDHDVCTLLVAGRINKRTPTHTHKHTCNTGLKPNAEDSSTAAAGTAIAISCIGGRQWGAIFYIKGCAVEAISCTGGRQWEGKSFERGVLLYNHDHFLHWWKAMWEKFFGRGMLLHKDDYFSFTRWWKAMGVLILERDRTLTISFMYFSSGARLALEACTAGTKCCPWQ